MLVSQIIISFIGWQHESGGTFGVAVRIRIKSARSFGNEQPGQSSAASCLWSGVGSHSLSSSTSQITGIHEICSMMILMRFAGPASATWIEPQWVQRKLWEPRCIECPTWSQPDSLEARTGVSWIRFRDSGFADSPSQPIESLWRSYSSRFSFAPAANR